MLAERNNNNNIKDIEMEKKKVLYLIKNLVRREIRLDEEFLRVKFIRKKKKNE